MTKILENPLISPLTSLSLPQQQPPNLHNNNPSSTFQNTHTLEDRQYTFKIIKRRSPWNKKVIMNKNEFCEPRINHQIKKVKIKFQKIYQIL